MSACCDGTDPSVEVPGIVSSLRCFRCTVCRYAVSPRSGRVLRIAPQTLTTQRVLMFHVSLYSDLSSSGWYSGNDLPKPFFLRCPTSSSRAPSFRNLARLLRFAARGATSLLLFSFFFGCYSQRGIDIAESAIPIGFGYLRELSFNSELTCFNAVFRAANLNSNFGDTMSQPDFLTPRQVDRSVPAPNQNLTYDKWSLGPFDEELWNDNSVRGGTLIFGTDCGNGLPGPWKTLLADRSAPLDAAWYYSFDSRQRTLLVVFPVTSDIVVLRQD